MWLTLSKWQYRKTIPGILCCQGYPLNQWGIGQGSCLYIPINPEIFCQQHIPVKSHYSLMIQWSLLQALIMSFFNSYNFDKKIIKVSHKFINRSNNYIDKHDSIENYKKKN